MTARDAIVNSLCPMLSGMFGIKLAVLLMLLGGTDGSAQARDSDSETNNVYQARSSGGVHSSGGTQVDTTYDPVTQLKKYDSNARKLVSKTADPVETWLGASLVSLVSFVSLAGGKSWSARPSRRTWALGPRYTCCWWAIRARASHKSRGLWYVISCYAEKYAIIAKSTEYISLPSPFLTASYRQASIRGPS